MQRIGLVWCERMDVDQTRWDYVHHPTARVMSYVYDRWHHSDVCTLASRCEDVVALALRDLHQVSAIV